MCGGMALFSLPVIRMQTYKFYSSPLRHPNIVQFYGAIMLPERLYFVMERLHMNLQLAIETWPIERIAR